MFKRPYKEAKVVRSFNVVQSNGEAKFEYGRFSPWRMGLSYLASFALGLTFLGAFIGFWLTFSDWQKRYPGNEKTRSTTGTVLLVTGAGMAGVFWWGFKRRSASFMINRDGYVVGKTLYRHKDVSYLGWRFGTDTIYNAGTVAGGAGLAASSASGVVYITHGTRNIALASGLPDGEVEQFYNEVRTAVHALVHASEKAA